jgi:hypothetical protein
MKILFSISLCLFTTFLHISAQNISSTFRTEYFQIFFGGTNGTSTTGDVTKTCTIFTIDNANNIIGRDCESQKIILNIKFVFSEATKYSTAGWSKRYSGYDPTSPSYGSDGNQILNEFITIIFKNNIYEIFSETVAGNISIAGKYFNL